MLRNLLSSHPKGAPEHFFGRRDLLERFDRALSDEHSDYRALFITGTHGMGKTSLLEQLAVRASERKRRVIELGPEDTIARLMRVLAGAENEPTDERSHVGAALGKDDSGHDTNPVSTTATRTPSRRPRNMAGSASKRCSWPPVREPTTVL